MPLAARTIEPIYLGRRPLKEEETGEEVVQVAVTQNAVMGALVQLASLVRHADDLFCDLADECQKVFEQTERIIQKVKRIKEGVGQLDAKTVSIPVGDLKRFSTVHDHHVAKHGFECSFFPPEARPHCIKFRYSLCEVTPVGALRGADPYRKDGLRSSDLFKLWPVVLKDHQINTADLNVPKYRVRAMSFDKKYKRLKQRRKTIDVVSVPQQTENGDDISTSSTDNHLSRSQPSIVVAVDTSGAGFHKMSSFRQSLKGTASLDRKSRRRTVSGVPDNIMREIELFERGKRTSRTMPRNYSFDDLDSRIEPDRDQLMMQYLDELDAKMEERAEEEYASRDRKLLKFLPCRRARSLPRCIKLKEGKSRGVMVFEQEESTKDKDKLIVTASSGYASSSLSLGSAGASSSSSRSSRSTRRSSFIGSKFKSFITETLRPRPKSLDLDSMDVLGNEADVDSSCSSIHTNANLRRKMSPSMPDDISSLTSSRESKVGPGTYYYFTSSTLPRAQARKYDFPWDSLPKDWTTSVKLREISKRRRAERNSSSGNWSGSSYRQSLDSERSSTVPSTSQYSLGRDSGRDSMGDDKDDGQLAKTKDTRLSSFMPLNSIDSVSSDSEQWLASLAKRAAAREDAVAAGSDVTESLTRLSELTKKNILALDETFAPSTLEPLRHDDEDLSDYSLDQDGFYTSFHTDSGLRRSTGTLLDDEGEQTSVKDTQSVLSMDSNNTVDSVIFRPMGDDTPDKTSSTGGKVRPPPPVRRGSKLSSSSNSVAESERPNDAESVQIEAGSADILEDMVFDFDEHHGESSPSDSDQETIYARLKVKTKISSLSIPSWCSISDEESPDGSGSHLSGASPMNAASISFSGNASGEDNFLKHSPFTDLQGKESAVGCKSGDQWGISSLPRRYLESKVWEEDLSDQSNSWPRSRRSQQQPMAGILKREKSPAGSLKQKTLNFAPVVSMYDHHSAKGIEVPLNAASSTSSSCSSDTSTAGLAFTLTHPPSTRSSRLSRSLLDVKNEKLPGEIGSSKISDDIHQHAFKATSTPVPKSHKRPQTIHIMENSGSSVSSSETSLPSVSDSGRDEYQDGSVDAGHSSQDTLSSTSSAALSDIDSSLTYVSMSSSNSTPTNSTLALDPDDVPTPVNSPIHEQAMIFPEIKNDQISNAKSSIPGSIPIRQESPKAFQFLDSTTSVMAGAGDKQPLGTFAANANTEAAPASWTGGQHNVMTASADSGFGSPTSPPTTVTEPHNHHYHHRHQNHRRTKAHSAKRSPLSSNQARGTQNLYENVHNGDTNTEDKSVDIHTRTARHKHEPMKASHELGSPLPQPSTSRSDSYRAATRDFERVSRESGKRIHSVVQPRVRSQSHAQVTSSSSPIPSQQLPESICSPSRVLADQDGVIRADSYRLAVRNTQGVVGDFATRNTSYRMATREHEPGFDDRMDAINSWERRRLSGGRDVRRMGITDIDQLKCYESDSSTGKASSSSLSEKSSLGEKSSPKGFAGIHSSHKKMTPEVQNLLRGDKTPSPEVKRTSKASSKSGKDKDKSRRSSTYIRFDPIFEQGDGMYSSTETLRAESVEMIMSEEGFLMSDKVVGQLPPGKVRSSGGRKNADEKTSMSILGSIKTTIKSISGKHTADKDLWKYDGGM